MNPLRTPRSRLGSIVVAAVAASALALPSSALAGGFTAKLFMSGSKPHQPKVGKQPLTVTATRGRQKLSGSVYYRFFAGGLTFKRSGGSFKHGVYHDKLAWPTSAIDKNVKLQVVVTTRYGTDYLNWWIKVRA